MNPIDLLFLVSWMEWYFYYDVGLRMFLYYRWFLDLEVLFVMPIYKYVKKKGGFL